MPKSQVVKAAKAWEAIVDAGLLHLLNKKVAERCDDRRVIIALKLAASKTQAAMVEAGVCSETTRDKGSPDSAGPSSQNQSLGGFGTKSAFICTTRNGAVGSGLNEKQSAIYDAQHSDPSRRHWPCSNPDFDCVESKYMGMKKCACGVSRYCSTTCQRVDWNVHRRICSARR